ncbi:replication terminator protein [Paenibacillus sp. BR1-192]|uniref:replication terminator protein n=1 Tax=Paenibacillus sp. BR1-192 TaxID=3032287 RepID=UPI00240E789B|nr:replication terminator protein [Paenibacillus sp. BR1-192]WFB60541.1 replication terminator protein [Paenibacillus sp. BR1-192]
MSKSAKITLESLANGGVVERFEQELEKVFANIGDPNTNAKATRKISLALTIKPDDKREVAEVTIQATTTSAPSKELMTTIIMDRDNDGKVVGAELKSSMQGQTYMDDEGDVRDDTGHKIKRIY